MHTMSGFICSQEVVNGKRKSTGLISSQGQLYMKATVAGPPVKTEGGFSVENMLSNVTLFYFRA